MRNQLIRRHLYCRTSSSFRCRKNSLPKCFSLDLGHDGKEQAENLVPKYNGIYNALKTIYQQEGFRGLFKGFHVSILTQASVTALFFWM